MFRGFGIGRAGHDPYFFAQNISSPNPMELLKEQWYMQCLFVIINLLKKPYKLILSRFLSLEGDDDVLKIEHNIGHLYFLFAKKGQFNRKVREIRKSSWNLVS
jgi:hypothetical protein